MEYIEFEESDNSMECCGVSYVHGLGGTYGRNPETVRIIRRELREAIEIATRMNKTMIIATTITDQRNGEDALEAEGFMSDVEAYRRPRQGNSIILWTKRLVP